MVRGRRTAFLVANGLKLGSVAGKVQEGRGSAKQCIVHLAAVNRDRRVRLAQRRVAPQEHLPHLGHLTYQTTKHPMAMQ